VEPDVGLDLEEEPGLEVAREQLACRRVAGRRLAGLDVEEIGLDAGDLDRSPPTP
jgi:hypothetical protein